MTQLALLRKAMTAFLAEQGVQALSAWPNAERVRPAAPLAVVHLKRFEAAPAGFQNYLGEFFDEQTQAWRERYGQKFQAAFSLDLYSPKSGGAEGCQALLDQVADALRQTGPDGLALEKLSMGQVGYDPASGMFFGKAEAGVQGILLTDTDEAGTFLQFEIKGEMTS